MTDDTPESDPKLVIDDDWKSQVEAEKEKLKANQPGGSEPEPRLPPASFSMLVSTLASQAMAGLGMLPDPIEDKPVVRLDLAKHMIDTLEILDRKTQGNLEPDESAMLTGTLHQLRLMFVEAKTQAGSSNQSATRSESTSGESKPSIELP